MRVWIHEGQITDGVLCYILDNLLAKHCYKLMDVVQFLLPLFFVCQTTSICTLTNSNATLSQCLNPAVSILVFTLLYSYNLPVYHRTILRVALPTNYKMHSEYQSWWQF